MNGFPNTARILVLCNFVSQYNKCLVFAKCIKKRKVQLQEDFYYSSVNEALSEKSTRENVQFSLTDQAVCQGEESFNKLNSLARLLLGAPGSRKQGSHFKAHRLF